MRVLVPPISGEPSPHGLLGGCVPVTLATDFHMLNGTELLPASCATANPWVDCPDPASGWTNPDSKIFDRPETCGFNPVTVYAGFECSTVGLSYDEMQAAALDQLTRGEQAALENYFMTQWLADATHTVDLTPAAGAVHIVNGVGVLESWLAETYGGRGVLHAPVGTASLLGMHRQMIDADCLETWAGNAVVLGAGYVANVGPAVPPAEPVPAPAGEAWLYITPPMRIRRDTPTQSFQRSELSVNMSINDRRALAETTFVAEVACCTAAAVRVTLAACC
jgi:hypothetical protein